MEQLGPFYGMFLTGSYFAGATIGVALLLLACGFLGAPLWIWALVGLVALWGFGAPVWLLGLFAAVTLLFIIKPIRTALVSSAVMKTFKALKLMPQISQTERTALEAGVIWTEADLFSGKPDFNKLMKEPYPELTAEEKAFLEGPCQELCSMIDSYELFKTKQLPTSVFNFMREKGFLGMIIPKEYGGLGFSHAAHSAVIQMISSRSIGAVTYIMVPNSLGPAELLVHYGTEAQKKKYLPRLADGTEVPCFGLTEPQAGSDAGSITSEGVLFKGEDGQIYIRLNWRKRWITLASISTLIGLAFRLRDPDNLLGKGEDIGITCALIPANLPGIMLGRRHDPLGIPFHNCPMEGHNVVVNAEECIIGGLEGGSGNGWGMLMESLGAGRGISLPAQGTAGCKLATRIATNHATVRRQFGLPIGKFEGVEEPMARIAGSAYLIEAMRSYVLSALDQGIKPPVVTAIAKYNATEIGRQAVNDGMDILGGAGISLGPRNVLAEGYIGMPISITVEGANILTRTLMIFGQGALRAHPYAFKELDAIEKNDLKAFDEAFWGHIGHIVTNTFRALILSFTRGRLAAAPGGPTKRYFQKLSWASASFAILADIAMGTLGGKLKVKEKLTGRFADILSWMFIGTSVLRRFEAEGRRKEDLPFVEYSMRITLHHIQQAFDGIYSNMNVPILGWIFRGPIRWWSRLNTMAFLPSDELTHKISSLVLADSEQRDRITDGIYLPQNPEEGLGRYERAFKVIKQAEGIEAKVKKAVKSKQLPKKRISALLDEALEKAIITREEYQTLKLSEELRWDAIQVDDFSDAEYVANPQATDYVKPHDTYPKKNDSAPARPVSEKQPVTS